MPTLDEVIQNPKMVIHTPNAEQALILMKNLTDKGCVWTSGESYLEDSCWEEYKADTCYMPYNGEFGRLIFFQYLKYTVVPFDKIEGIKNRRLDYDEALEIVLTDKHAFKEEATSVIREAIEKAKKYDEIEK